MFSFALNLFLLSINFFLYQYSPPATVLNSWGIRWIRIVDILCSPTCLLRHRVASAWEWGETSTKESSRMQPCLLVTVSCSPLPVPRSVAWLGHSCACWGESSREHKAGDNSEESRSVFVPVHGEEAVLAVKFLQATSWLNMYKQYALALLA